MIVVSDTSVVTSLIQIGRIEWLFEIFGGVKLKWVKLKLGKQKAEMKRGEETT